jgi:VanZ family protein
MAALLLVAWAALIVYASWFPLAGWRWPAGANVWTLLRLPWPRGQNNFDIFSNLLGYVPLGTLLVLAAGRHRGRGAAAARDATALAAVLSYALEVGQNLLPLRVPSLLDWLLNTAGAAIGALLGLWLARTDALGWLHRAGELWFAQRSRSGLALLALWPIGLLFPTPVALGLGQVWERVRDVLSDWFGGAATPPLARWLEAGPPATARLSPAAELLAVALGLLGPCLMTYSMARPGLRRIWLAVGATALGFGITTLSTALNFGPQHALAWCTSPRESGWWLSLQVLVWSRRRQPIRISLPACTDGNRDASSAFTAWHSGSVGTGPMRRRCGCCAKAPDASESSAPRPAPYNARWAGSPARFESRT